MKEFNVVANYKIDATQAKSEAQSLREAFGAVAKPLKGSLLDLKGVTRSLGGGLRPLRDDLKGLSTDVRKTDSALTRLLRPRRQANQGGGGAGLGLRLPGLGLPSVMGGGALLGGFTALISQVKSLNAEAQQSRTTIATLLATNGVYTFNDALGASRNVLSALRDDAAKGVGELDQYLGVYQQVLSPGLQSGAGLDQVREITGLLVAAGTALRGSQGATLAGFDVSQALNQGLGDRTTPILNQAIRAYGLTLSKFNKMGKEEKFTTLLSALKGFEPAIEAQGKTWDGVTSTMRDNIKSVVIGATEPLFDRWTTDLRRVNGWLDEHRDQINDIAEITGARLTSAWDRGIKLTKNWRGELQKAIPVLTTLAALQMVASGGGGAMVAAGSGVLGLGRRGGGALRRTFTRTPRVGPMHGPRIRPRDWMVDLKGPILGGGLGVAANGLAAMHSGGGKLLKVLSPIGKIAAKAAIPLILLTSGFEAFTANTFGASSALKTELGGLWMEVKKLFGGVMGILGNGLTRSLGGVLIGALTGIVWALKWGMKAINAVVAPVSALFQIIGMQLEAGLTFVMDIVKTRSLSKAQGNWQKSIDSGMADLVAQYRGGFAGSLPAKAAIPDASKAAVVTHVTNIDKVEVNQTVQQNADPDRVAWGWNDMLTKVQKHSKQARVAPVPVR